MAKAALHSRVLPDVDAKAWDALCAAWEEEGWLRRGGELVALASFAPHVPERLKPLVDGLLAEWEQAGLHAPDWRALCQAHRLAERDAEDLRTYLLASGQAQPLDDDRIVPAAVQGALRALWRATGEQGRFTIQEARDVLGLSRKTLIPLLELADRLGCTRREETVRVWVKEPGGLNSGIVNAQQKISTSEIEHFKKLGFTEDEIINFSDKEYEMYSKLKGKVVGTSEKYYRITKESGFVKITKENALKEVENLNNERNKSKDIQTSGVTIMGTTWSDTESVSWLRMTTTVTDIGYGEYWRIFNLKTHSNGLLNLYGA